MDVTNPDTSMEETPTKAEVKEELDAPDDPMETNGEAASTPVKKELVEEETLGDNVVMEEDEKKAVKVEKKDIIDDNGNTLGSKEPESNGGTEAEVKEEVEEKVSGEEAAEVEGATGEAPAADEEGTGEEEEEVKELEKSNSLLEDSAGGQAPALPAPAKVRGREGLGWTFMVISQVNISMKLTSSVVPERTERTVSVASEEEGEFDPEAVVVPPGSQEERDLAKPRLQGRRFTVMPPQSRDSDLSGLCSIM